MWFRLLHGNTVFVSDAFPSVGVKVPATAMGTICPSTWTIRLFGFACGHTEVELWASFSRWAPALGDDVSMPLVAF